MEAIEKLRRFLSNKTDMEVCLASKPPQHRIVCTDKEIEPYIDAIEKEMAERYMKLPLDADGLPVRIGDKMLDGGTPRVVSAVSDCHILLPGYSDGPYYRMAMANLHHHYHKPTVEDVLREFANDIAEVLGGEDFLLDENDDLYAEYASKLRLAGEE